MKGAILMPKIREKIILDKNNQLIVQMLIDNSRVPISKISKKIKISKPAVFQRIKKLEEKEIIIQYIAYYNLIKAGYQLYLIILETDKENEQKYAEKLSDCKFSSSVALIASKFNIVWMVFSKNNEQLNKTIEETTKTTNIKDLKVIPVVENYFDSYKLFEETSKNIKDSKIDNVNLDRVDAEILNTLKNNSRESLVNIANKCKLTAEAIKQRIKKLIENGIILSFFTNFNIFKLGFQPYMVLIKTNRQKKKEIIKFIRYHKNTNGQYSLNNEFDIMCIFVITNIYELREFIEQLHNLFEENILDYETYLITEQVFNDFFPKGIYEDII